MKVAYPIKTSVSHIQRWRARLHGSIFTSEIADDTFYLEERRRSCSSKPLRYANPQSVGPYKRYVIEFYKSNATVWNALLQRKDSSERRTGHVMNRHHIYLK